MRAFRPAAFKKTSCRDERPAFIRSRGKRLHLSAEDELGETQLLQPAITKNLNPLLNTGLKDLCYLILIYGMNGIIWDLKTLSFQGLNGTSKLNRVKIPTSKLV